MARYISHIPNLTLFNRDGTVRAQFVNGVYEIGQLTTNGGLYSIDPSVQTDADTSLQTPWSTDLLGATTQRIEMAGMGSLTKTNAAGSALTNLEDGYVRTFYYAPVISGGTATSSVVGVWYEVLSGNLTYNSIVYHKGDKFETVTGQTSTSGSTATYALTIPPDLAKDIDSYRDEYFEQVHLNDPSEATGYWDPMSGSTTYDSNVSTDTDYFGKIN